MGKVQACYTAKFKLEVVQYAQEHVNRAAGRKCDVDETNVRQLSGGERKKETNKIAGIYKKKCAFCGKNASIHMWKPNYISML
jgi:hypothetical protein